MIGCGLDAPILPRILTIVVGDIAETDAAMRCPAELSREVKVHDARQACSPEGQTACYLAARLGARGVSKPLCGPSDSP